jgi:uncharacterized protein YndB with AHSA1/START domain
MTHAMNVDLSNEREMVLSRLLDAPRALVWKCWTEPEHLAAWWGPNGMTNEVDQDLKPGGHQTVTMIDGNGNRYPVRMAVLEIEPERHLVTAINTDDMSDDWHEQFSDFADGKTSGAPRIHMTVSLEDAGDGKTLLTVTQVFTNRVERDANMKMGAEAGWRESFEKLDTLLGGMSGMTGD